MNDAARPMSESTEQILAGLKDFQRRTVDYVFRRMYTDTPPAERFLVADEVGLGKTMVAKGIIARSIEWHQQRKSKRVMIVYVCSNGAIARQNLNRLDVTGTATQSATRVTLLPLELHDFKPDGVNFISFTPGTSFDIGRATGKIDERALLLLLLQKAWNFRHVRSISEFFAVSANADTLEAKVEEIRPKVDDCKGFAASIHEEDRLEFEELRWRFRSSMDPDDAIKRQRNAWIGRMRSKLARDCIKTLEPDLIILDEFQRFKQLLKTREEDDEEGDGNDIARDFFNYEQARTLLLSATPYKGFTLAHETGDDHFADFLETIRFLHGSPSNSDELGSSNETVKLKGILQEYRKELFQLADGSVERLRIINEQLEYHLRRVMSRTERVVGQNDVNGMIREIEEQHGQLEAADVESFLTYRQIGKAVRQPEVMEYWKSAPYLLNFMEEYQFQRAFEDAAESPKTEGKIAKILATGRKALLPWKHITNYSAIEPTNSRLRGLLRDVIESGQWRLLWIPPSLPYYQLGKDFAKAREQGCTKRLVFSAWRVVPRAVSMLLSYEVERQMIRLKEVNPRNTPSEHKRRSRQKPLRFAKMGDRLIGMPALALIYPARVLAREADPLLLVHDVPESGVLPTQKVIMRRIRERLAQRLDEVVREWGADAGPEDKNWYWAAPILLDMTDNQQKTLAWFDAEERAQIWATGDDDASGRNESTYWHEHVDRVRQLLRREFRLGAPPKQLPAAVALMALSGPGVCCFRALARMTAENPSAEDVWDDAQDAAASAAWRFISLFSHPEVIALLMGNAGVRRPYWKRVLRYSARGCLQAVLDEFIHMLIDSPGMRKKSRRNATDEIAQKIREVLSLRTSSPKITRIERSLAKVTIDKRSMRTRFAMRFGNEKDDDGRETARIRSVSRSTLRFGHSFLRQRRLVRKG